MNAEMIWLGGHLVSAQETREQVFAMLREARREHADAINAANVRLSAAEDFARDELHRVADALAQQVYR